MTRNERIFFVCWIVMTLTAFFQSLNVISLGSQLQDCLLLTVSPAAHGL